MLLPSTGSQAEQNLLFSESAVPTTRLEVVGSSPGCMPYGFCLAQKSVNSQKRGQPAERAELVKCLGMWAESPIKVNSHG